MTGRWEGPLYLTLNRVLSLPAHAVIRSNGDECFVIARIEQETAVEVGDVVSLRLQSGGVVEGLVTEVVLLGGANSPSRVLRFLATPVVAATRAVG